MVTLLRRVFWLAVAGGAGFAVWSAWGRRSMSIKAGPPEWPPIEPPPSATTTDRPTDTETTGEGSSAAQAASDVTVSLLGGPLGSESPDAPPDGVLTWVESDGGACPSAHPIKANDNSGIFHVPGGRFYNQTRAERCYALAEDAEADGYRRAKS